MNGVLPSELRFLRITAVVAGVRVTERDTPLQPSWSPHREPLSHHGGAGEDGRDLCPKGAGVLCGPRSVEATNSDDARPSPVAIMGRLRRPKRASISRGAALSTVNKVVTPVNQLVHIVGRGDAHRGAYRREGDGAHRRGGGRGDEAVTTRLLSCTFTTTRRDKEVYLPDPARGR